MTLQISEGASKSQTWGTWLQGLIAVSRVGVYVRLPGVDVDAFSQSLQSGGLLSYIDALSGGSVSRVGVFSLGMPSTQHPPASGSAIITCWTHV